MCRALPVVSFLGYDTHCIVVVKFNVAETPLRRFISAVSAVRRRRLQRCAGRQRTPLRSDLALAGATARSLRSLQGESVIFFNAPFRPADWNAVANVSENRSLHPKPAGLLLLLLLLLNFYSGLDRLWKQKYSPELTVRGLSASSFQPGRA